MTFTGCTRELRISSSFFKKKSSFIRFHSLQLNFPSSVLWGYYSNNLLKVDASTKMCMFVHLQQII